LADVASPWEGPPPLPPPTYPSKQNGLCSPEYGGIRAPRAIRDLSMVISDALEEGSMGGIECSEEVIPEEKSLRNCIFLCKLVPLV